MTRNHHKTGSKVEVKDGNINSALRKLKNKIDDSNKLIEVIKRTSYEKPTAERKRKAGAARARWLKKLESESLPKKLY